MEKAKVVSYLEKGKDEGDNIVSYDLSYSDCGNPIGVIRYKDGKVESTDVFHGYMTTSGFRPPNARARRVPGIIRSASGFNYNSFVEVEPRNGKKGERRILHVEF
jgi:hypothetical protein